MTGHRNKKKWHARSSDGVAVECNAEFRQCPRTKDGEPHVYASTPQEAQQKIDAIKAEYMGKDLFASAFSKGRKVTQQPVGAGDNSPDRGKQWESMSLVEQGRECERVLQEACDSHQAISGLDMSLRHQYAERALSQAIRDGLKTSDTYSTKISAGPVYTPERRKLQQQIIDDVFKQHEDTPCEGKAIISGGMGGAGKTTVLTRYLNIDTDKYITVNPDDIKEIMAERGMIPTLRGLTPMECSTLAHDEASHISSIIMDRAIREKKNIILDGTMSKRSSMDSRVGRLKKGGYCSLTSHQKHPLKEPHPGTGEAWTSTRYLEKGTVAVSSPHQSTRATRQRIRHGSGHAAQRTWQACTPTALSRQNRLCSTTTVTHQDQCHTATSLGDWK